jgi:integrase
MSTTDASASKRTKIHSLGYGQGSLYSVVRADGETAYVHIYSDNGKQREVWLRASSKSAALKECASRNVRKDEGQLAAPSKRTFGDVAEAWFLILESRVKSGEIRPRTLALYRQRYRSHLEEKLSRRVMQKVTGSDVSTVIVGMRSNGLSPSVMGGVLMILGQICTFAVQRRYIASSPLLQVAKVERPKSGTKTEPRVLNLEEIGRLIEGAPASVRDLLSFVAFTGCRMSEGLAVRWGDLDLEAGTATISGQLARQTFQRVPTKTKTGMGPNGKGREVFLSDSLATVLKARRLKALERGLHSPDRLVFCTRTGAPLGHRNVSREIRRAGDNAGLNPEGVQPVSCHDLRHSFVSRLIANGIDPVTVASLAGDKVDTIMKVYAGDYDRARRANDLRDRISAASASL